MARNTVGRAGAEWAADSYQPTPSGGPGTLQPDLSPFPPPANSVATPKAKKKTAEDSPKRADKNRVDEWMEVDFKFGGSRIKRKAVALVLLGAPGLVPLFFMLPALVTLNSNTFAVSVDDTLGNGAQMCLFLCLLVTPMMTITGQRWFFPLRRWYGIVMGCTGIGDALAAGITDNFAGGVFGRLAGHVFELMGFLMVMLVVPLLLTGNPYAQRKLGKYWKKLHALIYVIWGLLALHLILLEGFGFQQGDNGSGFAGDGDPVFHQRFYQYSACSLLLLTLRIPPVKRWVAARQKEGRGWVVWVTVAPILALFLLGFIFITNEEIFKGVDSFLNTPSNE